MDKDSSYEIPFGAKDSELKGWEYTIPEGMEAIIENGKIIVREKESEDERIRRGLIDYFNDFTLPTFGGLDPKKIVAWLEKQGSQNLANSEKTCKVEPMFKVGDWVTNGIDVDKIIGIDLEDENYLFENGGKSDISLVESISHIWTIQDAKDGDVLYYKDEISLYKHDIKNCTKQETTFGGFVYHCCYDGEGFITDSLYSLTEQDKMDIHPATKEQRDKLENVMLNAGYKWDAEKKDLVKIEQNHAWSEEDEIWIDRACMLLDELNHLSTLTLAKIPSNVNDIISHLKSLKERHAWEPSDEQMHYLSWVANIKLGDGVVEQEVSKHLNELLNDLKKLKG